MKKAYFTLYLDESGDSLLHSLEDYSQNPELETHCTLTGVIIGHEKKALLKDELKELKRHFWHTDEVILHSVKIRHMQGPFAIFHYKPELYEEFKEKMNNITTIIEPTIVCSSLNKKLWVKKYPKKLFFKDDPYEEAVLLLFEPTTHFLNNQPFEIINGRIVAERRGQMKDNALKKTYQYVKEHGTQYHPKQFFEKLATKIEFHNKDFNIPGPQISDYVCYPFYVNHKDPKRENNHYNFLEQFIYPGEYNKYGYKKWPV